MGEASDDDIKSFVAGIYLGMRTHFAGKVDHIRSTVVEAPRRPCHHPQPLPFATGPVPAIPLIRLATISATCGSLSLARSNGAPSAMISAAPVPSKQLPAGTKAEQVAHAMGNTLSTSNALFATYVPVNVATMRDVMAVRRAGRSRLR
jgi:hypothetical protein